jgi:transposase
MRSSWRKLRATRIAWREILARPHKDPLRPLNLEERRTLEQLSCSGRESAAQVARAKVLLAVAEGHSYSDAARSVGRKSGDAVAKLVSRFNQEGLAAVMPRHGGGPVVRYDAGARQMILETWQRQPNCEEDGTATWSLSTLRDALHKQGLKVGRTTLYEVLREAGLSWQRSRSWCETGVALRKCKAGVVRVRDADTEAKKS